MPTFLLRSAAALLLLATGAASAAPVTVAVDPALDRRPLSPLIFGVNSGDPTTGLEPAYPLRRWGGNATTRYAWDIDVSNRASDWFFLNIPAPDPGTLPDGSSSDVFVAGSRADGAEVILTLSTIGWTPRDRQVRWGFDVPTYGPQSATECTVTGYPPWCRPDAGSGLRIDRTPVTGNDPLDTSRPITPAFNTAWMQHLAARFGNAASGGVRYYALDNEPMLWSSTHRDVHPTKLGYDELWQKTLDYGAAARQQDPAARILGPDSWGWCDYYFSDQDGCGNTAGADYLSRGPLLEWYAAEVCRDAASRGSRLIDVLDVHYYPQAAGVALSEDESAATSALRLRSLRSLYDPGYVDESWIGRPVNLIPTLRDIVARSCPGLQIAITEYSWGDDDGASSALAQAEVLAIFAREGVDLATRWEAPAAGSRVEDAFRLWLDYDGSGARVTGDSVRAASSDIDRVASYAVRASDGRVFVFLFNHSTVPEDVEVTVAAGASGAVPLFGFDPTRRLGAEGSVTGTAGAFAMTMPARAARLAVLGAAACIPPARAAGLLLTRDSTSAGLVWRWNDAPLALDHVVREEVVKGGSFATITGVAASGNPGLTLPLPPGSALYRVAGRNGCGEGTLD